MKRKEITDITDVFPEAVFSTSRGPVKVMYIDTNHVKVLPLYYFGTGEVLRTASETTVTLNQIHSVLANSIIQWQEKVDKTRILRDAALAKEKAEIAELQKIKPELQRLVSSIVGLPLHRMQSFEFDNTVTLKLDLIHVERLIRALGQADHGQEG